jgi:hypothetical protein
MAGRQVGIAALGAIAALALGTGTASAATVENGNFETGDLEGWNTDFFGPGAWFAYEGEYFGLPIRGPKPKPVLPAPPKGQFGAVSDQGMPSAMFLSQVVKLERGMKHKLKFQLAYANRNTGVPARGPDFPPGFHTPHHFRFGKAARPNQQFRMDVMKPDAPIKSLKSKHILERVYITERGDRNRRAYRAVKEDLTEHAGEKVRLRFAVAVTEAPLNVGIDAVKIRSKED